MRYPLNQEVLLLCTCRAKNVDFFTHVHRVHSVVLVAIISKSCVLRGSDRIVKTSTMLTPRPNVMTIFQIDRLNPKSPFGCGSAACNGAFPSACKV